MYYVYILECDRAFFYVGLSRNLRRRIFQHQNKQSPHTRRYQEIKLVYYEKYRRRSDAEAREKQLKGWSRAKKKALINSNIDQLVELSKSNPEIVEDNLGHEEQ
jgi:putative endonuclease